MENILVGVYVDPTCPFAWITSEWLAEVERERGVRLERRLMSLSAVNEGRELDDWYRAYNDGAWRPARVAAALLASPDADRWPELYDTFGHRRHVDGLRDDTTNLARTIAELGLQADLAAAADDPRWDDDLRARTREACRSDGGVDGTPMLHLNGKVYFGPVLTAVPRGEAAARLWDAVDVLATTDGFAEVRGVRDEDLHTS